MRNPTMPRSIRNAAPWVCLLVSACGMSGCEIGRSHFQMNSNSPSPFFGIDLMPRRSTTSVDPQSKTRTVEAGDSPVQSVAESKPRTPFWKSFSLQSAHSEPTPIPLTTLTDDRPINRGPVELLP